MPVVTRNRKRTLAAPAAGSQPPRKKGKEPEPEPEDSQSSHPTDTQPTSDLQLSVPPPNVCQVQLDLNDANCPICKELVRQPVSNHCGHTFCELCLLASDCSSCPMCSKHLDTKPAYMLRSLLEQLPQYQQHCRESSLDGLKEKLVQKYGQFLDYDTNYSEAIQCSILARLLNWPASVPIVDFTDVFCLSSLTLALYKLEPNHTFNLSFTAGNSRYLYLSTSVLSIFVWQHASDSAHPLKMDPAVIN